MGGILFTRFRLLVIASFAAFALLTAGAASAVSASSLGGSPSPGGCGCHHQQQLRPIQIELQQAADLADGYSSSNALVLGPGHLSLLNATDTESGMGHVDTFAVSPSSLTVWHPAGLGSPVVDLAVCQVRFTDDDQPFKILGGTGSYAGVFGHGVYDLTAVFSFGDNRHGKCSIDGLTLAQITGITGSGGGGNAPMTAGPLAAWCHRHHVSPPVLLTVTVDVQARGLAGIRHHKAPAPYGSPSPSPSTTTTAPVD
jgi:hypothetical protein